MSSYPDLASKYHVVPDVGTAGYTDLRTMQTYVSKPGSGTLTVTEVAGDRMRGSFRLTLYHATNGATIAVQGTFDAQRL